MACRQIDERPLDACHSAIRLPDTWRHAGEGADRGGSAIIRLMAEELLERVLREIRERKQAA